MSRKEQCPEEYFSISELAELLDIPKSTLRYYDAQHLINPERSADGNYRAYSDLMIMELTDIILLRNLGIPIKTIRSLLSDSTEACLSALDQATDETIQQLAMLNERLSRLTKAQRPRREYLSLRSRGYRIVERTDIQSLYKCSIRDTAFMKQYLEDPQRYQYAVYFKTASETTVFQDCMAEVPPVPGSILLWEQKAQPKQYLEGLLRTEYARTEQNNLDAALLYMKEHGLKPGYALASYLTYDFCPVEGKRYDYYHLWIEIK